MTGGDTPEMKSFQDYLTAILPVCFGVLNMTADEIYRATPWDVYMRIKGCEERQRLTRILLASFVTVPVINAGFSRPEEDVKVKDLIPNDVQNITEDEWDKWRKILNEAPKRCVTNGIR